MPTLAPPFSVFEKASRAPVRSSSVLAIKMPRPSPPGASPSGARLRARLAGRFRLNLGVYQGDELVGWTFGVQESPSHDTYYMVNTGVLPAHQGKGIYTALLQVVLEAVRTQGFQVVHSRHAATNARVLVPKLKAGFVVTGMELSDVFGTLVHLSYFFNPIRRKVLDVRAGQSHPDSDVRRVLPYQ